MNQLEAHDVTIRGEGPLDIVLGHGLGGSPAQWDPMVRHFEGRARVVTYSLAGSVGAKPATFSPVRHSSVLGFVDDLALICAELGTRGGVYIGHSLSGMAGALASAADPGLFSRLVLLNANARYLHDPAAGYLGGFNPQDVDDLLLAMASDFALWSAGFGPLMMGNRDRPELGTEFTRTLARYDPAVAATVFRVVFTSDLRSLMPRVGVPTLLVQSHADPAVPLDASRWLEQAIPGARLALLGAEGHFPHVVDPQEVIGAIEAFVLGGMR